MGSPTHIRSRMMPVAAACAGLCLGGCGQRGSVKEAGAPDRAQPVAQQSLNGPPRFQYAMGIEDGMQRDEALTALFSEWIKSDIQGLDEMLATWPRGDERWPRVLPALGRNLSALSDRIGKDPALVHLLSLASGAYAKLAPAEAVNWAHGLGQAGRDVALSVMVEEVALLSPEDATKLTNEIGDSVIRLDAIYGIAGVLGAEKHGTAFEWVATLPEENRPDAARAALEGWAHVNPGEALAYALREKLPGGMTTVFMQWASDAPGNAALAARAIADPRVRANAIEVVLDAFHQALPIDGRVSDWSGKLPEGAGRDAVNVLLAGDQAAKDPNGAWQITAAIGEEKTREEARRLVVAAVDPRTARQLIDGDKQLPAEEAAELRGLIAGQSPADR